MIPTPIKIAVAGAAGRMGRAVLEAAGRDSRFEVVAALARTGDAQRDTRVRIGDRDVPLTAELELPCDGLIDFTTGDGTAAWLSSCVARKIPIIIGATGLSEQTQRAVAEAARTVPIVQAANFSTGIHALASLLSRLSRALGESFDVEMVEAHHRHKRDVPSGTALLLLDELLAATGRTRAHDVVVGRTPEAEQRSPGQIGVHAIRMGEVVGQHEIHFSGPGESVTLTHVAHSRETFAVGALRAAAWVVHRPPGLYRMADVLSGDE